MIRNGRLAEAKLGLNPDKDTSGYTAFHQMHFGQAVRDRTNLAVTHSCRL